MHDALHQPERIDQRAYRIIEMRYFAGLSLEEIASTMDLSISTVTRSWQGARAFLFKELQ